MMHTRAQPHQHITANKSHITFTHARLCVYDGDMSPNLLIAQPCTRLFSSHPHSTHPTELNTFPSSNCTELMSPRLPQNHENQAIYQRALKILETYFGAEEEVADPVMQPEVHTAPHRTALGAMETNA